MDYILKDKLTKDQELRVTELSDKDCVEISIYDWDSPVEGRTVKVNLYDLIEALSNQVPEPPQEPQNNDIEA